MQYSLDGYLQELLQSPVYSKAVEESLPRVVAHAASVLEGVKERGAKVGDIMDAATEEALKPQVLPPPYTHTHVSQCSIMLCLIPHEK